MQCKWLFVYYICFATVFFSHICVAGDVDEVEIPLPYIQASDDEQVVIEEEDEPGGFSEVLTSQDCEKCHQDPIKEIEADGMAHKTKVTCTDCHRGHPPENREIIPECSMCHQDEPHFNLPLCLGCHVNPHTPLKIKLTKKVTEPCTTCHNEQIIQLRDKPSFHSKLYCTACHNQHGQIPDCSRCHRPHSDSMTEDICHLCHKAHMPLVVNYGAGIASENCGACHEEAFGLLAESPTRHRLIPCVQCHAEKHKMVPRCQNCHSLPHPEEIHEKFPVCGDCHGIAHNLGPTDVAHKRARDRNGAKMPRK